MRVQGGFSFSSSPVGLSPSLPPSLPLGLTNHPASSLPFSNLPLAALRAAHPQTRGLSAAAAPTNTPNHNTFKTMTGPDRASLPAVEIPSLLLPIEQHSQKNHTPRASPPSPCLSLPPSSPADLAQSGGQPVGKLEFPQLQELRPVAVVDPGQRGLLL